MTRKEKYQFLRSIGLSAQLARKWRDRKIEKLETKDKNIIMKYNKELRKDYQNYTNKVRYNFLRQIGLSAERARKLRKNKSVNIENLTIRGNKIIKNKNYYKLFENIKENLPEVNFLTFETKIKKYIRKYKNVENYGVYTKWGTLTRVEPYKHETNRLVSEIKEIFGANTKQSYYILYLMYEYGQTLDQIIEIIKTDPLYEQYAKEK